MTLRTRKLVGTIILVGLLMIYFLVAMVATAAVLPGKHIIVQTIGYAFAGLIWVLPAGLLIRWMSRPDPES